MHALAWARTPGTSKPLPIHFRKLGFLVSKTLLLDAFSSQRCCLCACFLVDHICSELKASFDVCSPMIIHLQAHGPHVFCAAAPTCIHSSWLCCHDVMHARARPGQATHASSQPDVSALSDRAEASTLALARALAAGRLRHSRQLNSRFADPCDALCLQVSNLHAIYRTLVRSGTVCRP